MLASIMDKLKRGDSLSTEEREFLVRGLERGITQNVRAIDKIFELEPRPKPRSINRDTYHMLIALQKAEEDGHSPGAAAELVGEEFGVDPASVLRARARLVGLDSFKLKPPRSKK